MADILSSSRQDISLSPMGEFIAALGRRWPFARGKSFLMRQMEAILGNDPFIIKTLLRGSPIALALPGPDPTTTELVTFGEDDAALFDLISAALSSLKESGNAPLFVDIGAHFGVYSFRLSKNLQLPSLQFEPQSTLAQLLSLQTATLGLELLVTTRHAALGNRVGVATMFQSREMSANSKVIDDPDGSVEVPQSTLDDELVDLPMNSVPVLKIDVEGYELEVLQGARQTLLTHQPLVVFEINFEELRQRNRVPQETSNYLRSLGYTDFYVVGHKLYPPTNGVPPVCNVAAFGPRTINASAIGTIDLNYVPAVIGLTPLISLSL